MHLNPDTPLKKRLLDALETLSRPTFDELAAAAGATHDSAVNAMWELKQIGAVRYVTKQCIVVRGAGDED